MQPSIPSSRVRSLWFTVLTALASAAVALAGYALPQPALTAQTAGEAIAFADVNVLPMDGERVLEQQTVVVRGGRIASIAPAGEAEIPADAVLIDGRGRYLIPGLAEMHAHIPPASAGEQYVEQVLFLYVSNGITTIRGMLGQPEHLALRERVAAGEILAPRIYTSGPSFSGQSAQTPDAARQMVREQKAAGYDLLKLHPGLTREVFDAIVDEARRADITFAGHVSTGVGLARALEAGQRSIDHLDGYMEALAGEGAPEQSTFFGLNLVDHVDESRIPELARRTREAGVWNVPTQSLFLDWLGTEDPAALARTRPDIRYMPLPTVENWIKAVENMRANPAYSPEAVTRLLAVRSRVIRALHEAGAPLLLGSDAPQVFNVPGFSIHQELEAIVAAGLTPYEALVTGTRNVAVFFGEETEYGTVEEGKVADLLLLEANPFEDIGHVARRAGVMVGGQWLPESEIQRQLESIAAAAKSE